MKNGRLEMDLALGKAEVIIAKQRHGPTGTVKLQFEGQFTRFSDFVEEDNLPYRVRYPLVARLNRRAAARKSAA